MTSIVTKEHDNVYVNVTFTNTTGDINGTLMKYNESKTQPIVKKASDYYCSIIRFDLPLSLVPLLIFPVIPGSGLTQTSPWAIGIRTGAGNDFVTNCIYVPQDDELQPVNQTNPNFQIISPFYYMYDYNGIVYILNTALNSSFIAAGSPGGTSPYFIYNYNGYLSIIFTHAFFLTGGKIIWNTPLDVLLGYGFPSIFRNGFNVLNFVPRVNFAYPLPLALGSIPSAYKFDMEFNGCIGWSNVRKIVITTNNIPIVGENIPVISNSGEQSGETSYFPIISDFILQINNTSDPRSIAYYIPNPQYKLCDMLSDTPIYKIDFQIFFSDLTGKLYPMLLATENTGSVKLAFLRKSLYKN